MGMYFQPCNFFTLNEFFRSLSSTERLNVLNSRSLTANLLNIIQILNHLREFSGQPIIVNSWYRDTPHNTRIGGSKTSQHLDGSAVDITSPSIERLLPHISFLCDFLGQVIYYPDKNFIHLALPSKKYPNFTLFKSLNNKLKPFNI